MFRSSIQPKQSTLSYLLEKQYTWDEAPKDGLECDFMPTQHCFRRYKEKFKIYGTCKYCGQQWSDIRTIDCPGRSEYFAALRRERTEFHMERAGVRRQREEEQETSDQAKPPNSAEQKKEEPKEQKEQEQKNNDATTLTQM